MRIKAMKRFGNKSIAKKRIIALMLSLALIFAVLPGAAVAQPEGLVGYESKYVQENYELVIDEASENEEYAIDKELSDAVSDESKVATEEADALAPAVIEAVEEVESFGYEEFAPFITTVSNSTELRAAIAASYAGERIYFDSNFNFTAWGAAMLNAERAGLGDIDVVFVGTSPGHTVTVGAGTGVHLMNFQFNPAIDVTFTFEDLILDGNGVAGPIRYMAVGNGTMTLNNADMRNFIGGTGAFLHSPPAGTVSNFVVNNSSFTGGVATNGGGAILTNTGSVTASNSIFANNTANGPAGGGAIHATPVHINNSIFENNTAALGGGGAISSGGGTITNTNFENNTARNGGALLSSGVMNVTSSAFVDNTATITQAALDAMIFGVDPDPVFNPTPLPQWALDAGWTSWTELFTYLMGGGGAINHSGPGLLTVRDSDFIDNVSATNGGSIWARADHRDVWCDNGEDAFGAGVDCGNFFSGNTPPQYFESCAFPTVTFRFYTRSADGTVTAHVGTLTRADIPVGTTITLAMVPALAGFPGADFLPAAFMPNYTAVVVVEDAADNMVRVVFVARTPEVNVPNNPCPNDPTQECECPVPPPVSCDDCESYPCECDTEVLEAEEETDTGTDRRRPAGEGPKTGDNTNFFAQIAAMAALVVTVAVTGLVRTREQD